MGIKSQQDIKNETKAKGDKIPKSMENKSNPPQLQSNNQQKPQQTITPLIERVSSIEEYLIKVDIAFEKIVIEIENLKTITQNMDIEISKITGDSVRLMKLEEERYIELATAINQINEKLKLFDEHIPVYIDKRINDFFEDITTDTGEPDTNNQET
jgi:hypothetical protein